MNMFNRYFKYNVIEDKWDLEKFSLKEAQSDIEVDKQAQRMWNLTKAIGNLEKSLKEEKLKNWREIKLLYEQLTIAIDGEDSELDQLQKTF
jgi:hypothetical protein